jgi:hypothetical protein
MIGLRRHRICSTSSFRLLTGAGICDHPLEPLFVERFVDLAISRALDYRGRRVSAERWREPSPRNLLLRDKKGRLFLLAIHEDRELDLKTLHTTVGASGRLGFASGERMIEVLGVAPGALTPLGIINDHDGLVTVVLDGVLIDPEQVNFHPLVNTGSTGLSPGELVSFIRSCGRDPPIVDLGPTGGA